MEHYRSTLATAAIAAFGLVAAAHILHPGNYEMQPRRVAPSVAIAATAPAWVDPPAARQVAAAPTGPADTAAPSGVARILAPETVAALPPGAITTPPISGTMAPRPDRARKASVLHQRKLAQRSIRNRQASLDRGNVGATAAVQRADTSAPRPRIDPIGDLMRGLGLGGEG